VALGAIEPKFFAELARRIGLEERFVAAQYDRSQWPGMREAIAARIRLHTRDEWCVQVEGTDACFAPVLTMQEAPEHPHARARQAYVEVGGVVQPAPAPRFERSVPEAPRAAPEPGAHTAQVLAEAGLGPGEIETLKELGAIAR
jgi:alpha-methylacyl-CoA racemase